MYELLLILRNYLFLSYDNLIIRVLDIFISVGIMADNIQMLYVHKNIV